MDSLDEIRINCPDSSDRSFLALACIMAIASNSTFLYLILKHSSSVIRPYKRVLIVSPIADMLCSVVLILVIAVSLETTHFLLCVP